jgi:hypothetical protein
MTLVSLLNFSLSAMSTVVPHLSGFAFHSTKIAHKNDSGKYLTHSIFGYYFH